MRTVLKLTAGQIKPRVSGHGGCTATDPIAVDGRLHVRLTYREATVNRVDSGWRLMSCYRLGGFLPFSVGSKRLFAAVLNCRMKLFNVNIDFRYFYIYMVPALCLSYPVPRDSTLLPRNYVLRTILGKICRVDTFQAQLEKGVADSITSSCPR